ncbi:MAG TPA: Fic family protein [Acidobacteriaceae bacterium]|jgi:cell filamentation protein|nr:Fic family protein [Acidobacteriaceae bacterium]
MSSEAYDAFEDPYAYPGTTVLRNLLDIHDGTRLEAFEVEISTLRSEEPLPDGGFDPPHYCSVHRHLFQDVYEWAGQYRTVRTAKGGNAFCYPENISTQMDALFQELHEGQFLQHRSRDVFLSGITRFLGELNAVHPFREGNGRSQLVFLGLLGTTFGHPFDFQKLDRETFLPAMIASYSGDRRRLLAELKKLLL